MIHRKKNRGHQATRIVKSQESYSNCHLPYYYYYYYYSFYDLAGALMHDGICVRSKDAQKQLARTSLSTYSKKKKKKTLIS